MNIRIAAAFLSIAITTSNAHAIDWIDRAVRACSEANVAAADCQERTALVREAMSVAGGGHGASLADAARAVAAYVVLERLYPDFQPGSKWSSPRASPHSRKARRRPMRSSPDAVRPKPSSRPADP
jgi:hypothetical protein